MVAPACGKPKQLAWEPLIPRRPLWDTIRRAVVWPQRAAPQLAPPTAEADRRGAIETRQDAAYKVGGETIFHSQRSRQEARLKSRPIFVSF